MIFKYTIIPLSTEAMLVRDNLVVLPLVSIPRHLQIFMILNFYVGIALSSEPGGAGFILSGTEKKIIYIY